MTRPPVAVYAAAIVCAVTPCLVSAQAPTTPDDARKLLETDKGKLEATQRRSKELKADMDKLGAERQKILQDAMAVVEANAGERLKLDEAERKRQAEVGIKAIQLPPAEAKKWSDTAKEAGWAAVIKVSPDHGAKLRELLTKK